jgi:hypothetical protein
MDPTGLEDCVAGACNNSEHKPSVNVWERDEATQDQATTNFGQSKIIHHNVDGTDEVAVTTTSVTVRTDKGHEGEFVTATQKTEFMTVESGTNTIVSLDGKTGTWDISYGQASAAIGADNMAQAIQAGIPGTAAHFPHQVAQDISHHRYGTAGLVIRSIGLALAPVSLGWSLTLGISGEAIGIIDSAHDYKPYP